MHKNKIQLGADDVAGLTPENAARLQKQAEQLNREIDAKASLAGEPLPGPLFEAFAREQLTAAGFTIRPVVAYDIVILRKLNSPLYRQMLEQSKPVEQRAKTEWDEDEAFEMIFQFVRPIEEVRATLNRGRDAFRETALRLVADKINWLFVPQLVELVVQNFVAAFATSIEYRAGSGDNGEQVFTQPPAAARTTDSAGGLITSPV